MRAVAIVPFGPTTEGNTQAISVANNSTDITISTPFPKNPEYSGCILVSNAIAAATAFVRQGSSAQTASAADVPVLAGQTRIIDLKPDTTHVAVFSTGTGTVYVTPGSGGV